MSLGPKSRLRFVLLQLLVASFWSATAWGLAALSHQSWSTEEGLPDASVHQVFQSRDGYLWLATEGGVARFDGFSFKILSHKTEPAFASDDVSAIAQDTTGALWFGTADGLIECRGTSLRRFDEHEGLPSSIILSLSTDADGLSVLTSRGLVHMQGQRFIPANLTSVNVSQVQASPSGAAWTSTSSAVTVTTRGVTRTLHIGSDLPGTRTTALLVDHSGVAWIGTNRGLSSFDPRADSRAEASPILQGDAVLSIMEDREGNLWIGTETSGLHVLRPRKFRGESVAAGEAVTAGAKASDGTVWYGTRRDGLHSIARSTGNHPNAASQPFASPLTSPVILSLAPGKSGELWVGTPDGLDRVLGRGVQQYTSANGLPDDFVRSILVDSQGSVWAGTRQGLVRINPDKREELTTYTEADGLGSNSIGPILEAQAASGSKSSASSIELWIGTSNGLSHFKDNRFEHVSPPLMSGSNVVTAIARDDTGTLWIALHGRSLSRFANGTFQAIPSSALPAEIVSLVNDRQGYLWLRGLQGVYRVALAALDACAGDVAKCAFPVAHYGVSEGLPSEAIAAEGMPAMWQGPDNELWVATRKGIAVTDPAHLPINLVPPPVVLQHLVVDDSDVPFDEGSVRIGSGHNRYTFDYAALSYTLPSRVHYRYMLEGFDHNWVDAGSQRAAFYTSLPPRTYRFRVQAENEDGIWSTSDAELRLQILPPIYRRWWFYALLVLAAAGLAWLLLHLRLRVIRRRFALVLNERNRVAREIHDTLAQDFVSVSLQLDLASHMLKARQLEQATTQLQATRSLVKEGLESARQSIWNLRADAAAESLPARLTALVKRYTDTKPDPRLKMGGAYRKLANSVEDDIFRIAQESLSNSYRHAGATEVSLLLHYESLALRLTISDNGRGFSPHEGSSRQGHYGLRGMAERAALLGATLTIESGQEKGTVVTLQLPLGSKKEGVR